MAQISLYIDDAMVKRLQAAAATRNYSVSKYVATILHERLSQDIEEEKRKKDMLRRLRGAAKDPTLTEPAELPSDRDVLRRYELI